MNYPLQYIVFPDSVNTTEDMYIREKDITINRNDSTSNWRCLSFDTYFNTFSLKKWLTYTSLTDLKLVIKASGNYWLDIYELNRDNTEKKIKTITFSSNILEENVIDIPLSSPQMIFFRLYHQGNLTVEEIYYATETEPVNDIYLSAVICTFKKEYYVYRNIRLFKEIYKKHPELLEKFEVNVVDNGQSLDITKIDSPNTKVYPNINTGGRRLRQGNDRGIEETKESLSYSSYG